MTLFALKGVKPKLGSGVFVAPTASVIGDVVIGDAAHGRRLHPGVFVIAAWQLSVAGVVIASTA